MQNNAKGWPMKFSRACELLLLLICLISFSVTGCVTVSVNTDSANQSGIPPGCELDPNTGQVFCADACEKTYEHTVTVAMHQNLEEFNSDVVYRILEEAQNAAQKAEGVFSNGNVECQVSFKMVSGGMNEITEEEMDDTVDTEEEYISLMQRPEWVKVVNSLYICAINGQMVNNYPSHFSGCGTDYPYKLSIVEYDDQYPATYHGPLWLHEIGHTRGNIHKPWEQGDSWVMYPAPTENSRKLTCRECARYLLP